MPDNGTRRWKSLDNGGEKENPWLLQESSSVSVTMIALPKLPTCSLSIPQAGFVVRTAVVMMSSIFWDITPCSVSWWFLAWLLLRHVRPKRWADFQWTTRRHIPQDRALQVFLNLWTWEKIAIVYAVPEASGAHKWNRPASPTDRLTDIFNVLPRPNMKIMSWKCLVLGLIPACYSLRMVNMIYETADTFRSLAQRTLGASRLYWQILGVQFTAGRFPAAYAKLFLAKTGRSSRYFKAGFSATV
jgi:hypothetical protein